MVYAGFRRKYAAVSVNPGPISEINIFQIGKMIFVQHSDLFEYCHTVDSGSAAGSKNGISCPVFFLRPALSERKGPSKCTVQIAGIVNPAFIFHGNHFCRSRENPFILLHNRFQLPHKTRLHDRIVIQENNILRCRCHNARIHRPAESRVYRKGNILHFRKIIGYQVERAVGGTVIDHDDMRIFLCQRFQAFFQIMPAVAGRYYNR